ncbi:MAG: leucine-rich repeat protein [Clostridia bacterium]|nr:leucine-rich repeat protein [Clostridia bacterium]
MKKISTKIISAIIVLMMLVNIIPIAIFAEELKSDEVMTVSASETWGAPGDSVKINVNLENNPGIASMKIFVAYDEYLTLTAVEFDSDFGAYVTAPEPFANPQPLSYINPTSETTAVGTFATLTFKIAENAPDNYNATIRITCDEENIFDENYDPVAVETKDGFVTVYHGIPGDMNSDLKVNNQDAILLFRHVAGWSVDIDPLALDFNGDNSVNNKDAISLFRYVAGWTEDFVPNYGEVHTHKLTYNEAKDATCTEDGNVAYYQCDECDKCYSDEKAKTEISTSDVVISAIGHDAVIDEALAPTYESTGLTEGSHCGVCGEVLKAQEEIPMLEADYYSVTYKNVKTATIPEGFDRYASHKGLASLPEISVPGYNFLGWFDGENRIEKIAAGSNENVVLEARWEIITYTITYYCGNGLNSPNNITSYDVNTSFVLVDATLKGCRFYRWVDQNGEPITKIERGSVGDLILTAEYKENRYITVPISEIETPKHDSEVAFAEYDSERNLYKYVYYLGYVSNVPLTQTSGVFYNGIGDVSSGLTVVTASQTSIEKGISASKSYTLSSELSSTITAKEEIEIPGSKTSIDASVSASLGTTETVSETASISKAITRSEQLSKDVSITIPDNSPVGYYRITYMGTLDMYIAVVYDPTNDQIDIVEYSLLRDDTLFSLDYSQTADFGGYSSDEFEFVIPTEVQEHILYLSEGSEGFISEINGNECVIKAYEGTDVNVKIPTYYKGKKVTAFDTGLFAGNTSVISVTFGEGVTSIPNGAFEGCTSLKSVVFNGNLTEIGEKAFSGCTTLEFDISDTVTSIGNLAFNECERIDNVILSENITLLGDSVFNACGTLVLTVNSSNLEVVKNAVLSGATNTCVNWIYSDISKNADCVLTVPETQTFKFNGNHQTFNNLCIISMAADTAIEYVTINNTTGENALEFASTNVNLRSLTVTSNKIALNLLADSVNLSIGENVTLTAKNSSDGLKANDITISSAVGESVKLYVTGGAGTPGGNGINVNGTLTVMGYIDLNVKGGNGFRGNDGNCADHQGDDGEDGGAGFAGGNGVNADEVQIISGVIVIEGGSGGQGGSGGCANPDWGGKEYGGDGGAGGKGGIGLYANSLVIIGGSLDVTGGQGGKGGDRGGLYDEKVYGEYGSYGYGGSGGAAINDTCVIEDDTDSITINNGSNGGVGTGEDCRDH